MEKKFEVITASQDDDSYFYSYTRYYWHVVSVKTGDELHYFSGSVDSDRSGTTEQGVLNVQINEDETKVIVISLGRAVAHIELPQKVDFVGDGQQFIMLTYQNGQIVQQDRREATYGLKFGCSVSLYPLKYPQG